MNAATASQPKSFSAFLQSYWDTLLIAAIMLGAAMFHFNTGGIDDALRSAIIGVVSIIAIYTAFTKSRNTTINSIVIVLLAVFLYSQSGRLFAYSRDDLGNLIVVLFLIPTALTLINILAQKIRQAKQEVEAERAKLETILEGIGDGVAVIDPAWRVMLWNKTAEKITGWPKAEALGKHITEALKLIDRSSREQSYEFIVQAVASHKNTSLSENVLLITKDGTERHVGDSAAPLFDGRGELVYVVLVFRDTTEEHAARQMRSDYAYASHQLRTPVTEALWLVDQAQGEKDSQKVQAMLSEVTTSLNSVSKLANNLVTASELDQGMIVPKIETVALKDLLEAVVKKLRDRAAQQAVVIEIAGVPADTKVETDPIIGTNIFEELLENAVNFSAKQTVVHVGAERHENEYVVHITNTGQPLPEEEKTLVFTKFFRGSNNEKRAPGSGLGLPITKSYVELVKGRIWFKTTPQGETTFFVALPTR